MSTIYDVAKLAGVSKTTVSRFLNGNGPIREETKHKIEDAMEKLSFTPNYFAQGIKTSRTKAIGILVPDLSNQFYAEMFKGIEDAARLEGYMCMICNSNVEAIRELEYIKEFERRCLDGIIFCTYKGVRKNIDYLINMSHSIPVVFMDHVVEDEPVSYIMIDGLKSTLKAANYLIGKGRKRIGYIKGSTRYKVTDERYKGYLQALTEAGIKYEAQFVYEGDFTIDSGWSGAEFLMRQQNPPNAIMAATDLMAIGAMKYLKHAGIQVPKEVNVIGFDGIPLSEMVEPALTTITQGMPIKELGTRVMKILIEKIKNPKTENIREVFEGELVVRGSTD